MTNLNVPIINIPIVNISDPIPTNLESSFNTNVDSNGFIPSMNIDPVFHEIRHALKALKEQGKTTVIDLSSMPFAPGEKDQLRESLKVGEIEIKLNAMGTSYLHETSYPGVWWVDHYSLDENLTGSYIEITSVPEIVLADKQDISDGLQRFTQFLEQRSESHE